MEIKKIESWEQAEKLAKVTNRNICLFKIKDGQQSWEWKNLGTVYGLINLRDFYPNYNVLSFENFKIEEFGFLDEQLKNEDITEEEIQEVQKRKKEIEQLIEEGKKYNHEVVIQTPTGTEWTDFLLKTYEHDDVWTFQIGIPIKTLSEIESDIVNYFGGIGVDDYSDEQTQVMAIYNREWDKVECDADGANPEQDKQLDEIIENCAKKVLEIEKKIFA